MMLLFLNYYSFTILLIKLFAKLKFQFFYALNFKLINYEGNILILVRRKIKRLKYFFVCY